jgi:hypothetical protein
MVTWKRTRHDISELIEGFDGSVHRLASEVNFVHVAKGGVLEAKHACLTAILRWSERALEVASGGAWSSNPAGRLADLVTSASERSERGTKNESGTLKPSFRMESGVTKPRRVLEIWRLALAKCLCRASFRCFDGILLSRRPWECVGASAAGGACR